MGLIKEKTLENGIVLTYHRIESINKTTNECNVINVLSYLNKEQRLKQKEHPENNYYTELISIPVSYDDNMTITDAYNILKTNEMFINSQDDIDD